MTTIASSTNTLRVPGAQLHYQVRGSGPVLLLICGGVYDADGYAGLAQQLADRYTVVTYDRRGNSRSPLDGPPAPQSIEVHGDDAHRILTAVGVTDRAPARVFGNSSGAIIGLELAARHPEQVRDLIAHEPPLFDVLPDRERFRVLIRDVQDTFATRGPEPAMQVLGAGLQMGGAAEEDHRIPGGAEAPQGEPDPETLAAMARMGQNMQFFIGYEVPPFAAYQLDLAALKDSSVHVVMAVGERSTGEPPARSAVAIAELLGTETAVFPGDHGGFGARPAEFATRLDEAIRR